MSANGPFERGSIEPCSDSNVSRAVARCARGDVRASVSCVGADWQRGIARYVVRIVNSTDLLMQVRFPDCDPAGGLPVSTFCVYERRFYVPITRVESPLRVDVEGPGIALSVELPLPEREPAPNARGTTTGTIFGG